jgi:2-dehydro-3-deoxyphosphooctonate aldolase (KDO 8-P synthase)
MRSVVIMKGLGYPVLYDATHSVQLPGGAGHASAGQREMVYPRARAAVAAGADGLFLEVHEEPEKALSDSATTLAVDQLAPLLRQVKEIREIILGTRGQGRR